MRVRGASPAADNASAQALSEGAVFTPAGTCTLDGRNYQVFREPETQSWSTADAKRWQDIETSRVGAFELDGIRHVIVPEHARRPVNERNPVDVLTGRELQIVTLVAAGRPNKEIAMRLRISEWTVSTHLRRIFAKLGVDSRAAMVYRCAELLNPRGSESYPVESESFGKSRD